jgi:hypothetical protein
MNTENYVDFTIHSASRHWIQAKIIIFIRGHLSPCSICLEERNQTVYLSIANNGRDMFLKFRARY